MDFLLDLLVSLRMLAEQGPGPGERGCGCFMTCTKEGGALGHHLLITHEFANFVPDLQ